jgi:hypothetical protein
VLGIQRVLSEVGYARYEVKWLVRGKRVRGRAAAFASAVEGQTKGRCAAVADPGERSHLEVEASSMTYSVATQPVNALPWRVAHPPANAWSKTHLKPPLRACLPRRRRKSATWSAFLLHGYFGFPRGLGPLVFSIKHNLSERAKIKHNLPRDTGYLALKSSGLSPRADRKVGPRRSKAYRGVS